MHFTKALVKGLLVIGIVQLSLQTKAQRVVPVGYEEWISDDFNTFNSSLWSRGLEDDTPGSDKKLIWNNTTGGSGLLNDNYAGYITNEDSYVENGALMLRNQQRVYQGTDPAAQFNYTSGWINSCGKVLINGTERGVCLKLRAKFPVGKEVWPAIWLVTDAPHWPPEIDIWEYFGQFFNATNKKELMALRYIYGHWTDPINVKHELLSFDSTYDITQWHEYSWEWTDEAMIWKIDDIIIGTMSKGIADGGTWPNKVIPSENWPDEDFALVINNGIMTALAGQGAVYPNYLQLDWLDIYRASNPTNIQDSKVLPEINLYPNPVTDILNISGLSKTSTVKVINSNGSIVKEVVVSEQINLSDLPQGIYFFNIEGYKPFKVVKK